MGKTTPQLITTEWVHLPIRRLGCKVDLTLQVAHKSGITTYYTTTLHLRMFTGGKQSFCE